MKKYLVFWRHGDAVRARQPDASSNWQISQGWDNMRLNFTTPEQAEAHAEEFTAGLKTGFIETEIREIELPD